MVSEVKKRIGRVKHYKHDKSLALLNRLAIDLKKREIGLAHDPITVKRVDDIMKTVRGDLEQCWSYLEVQRLNKKGKEGDHEK